MNIRCEIVSQERLVFEGDADIVIIPGANGEMGILPNHAPLLSTMVMGVIKVRFSGQEEVFTITGGVVEVQPDLVIVLADAAEDVEEIDIARAEEAKKRAEELLSQGPPAEDLDAYLTISWRSGSAVVGRRRSQSDTAVLCFYWTIFNNCMYSMIPTPPMEH